MAWILDLDGVVWLGDEPIAGAAQAVARLRVRGDRVLLVSNNSSARVDDYLAKLERVGVPTGGADLVTSGQAAATLLEPGQTALVCAGPGVEEALHGRGVHTTPDGDADAVVVGWHRDFDYEGLTRAATACTTFGRGSRRFLHLLSRGDFAIGSTQVGTRDEIVNVVELQHIGDCPIFALFHLVKCTQPSNQHLHTRMLDDVAVNENDRWQWRVFASRDHCGRCRRKAS